jgi:hypothetical protein
MMYQAVSYEIVEAYKFFMKKLGVKTKDLINTENRAHPLVVKDTWADFSAIAKHGHGKIQDTTKEQLLYALEEAAKMKKAAQSDIDKYISALKDRFDMKKTFAEMQKSLDIDMVAFMSRENTFLLNRYFSEYSRIDSKSYAVLSAFQSLLPAAREDLLQKSGELLQTTNATNPLATVTSDIAAFSKLAQLDYVWLKAESKKAKATQVKKELKAKIKEYLSQEGSNTIFIQDIHHITTKPPQCWGYLVTYKLISLSGDSEKELIAHIVKLLEADIKAVESRLSAEDAIKSWELYDLKGCLRFIREVFA